MNPKQSLYSVPRKLDLATLLVLTGCYGALFAFMNFLHCRAQDVIVVSAYFTCIAIAQALLFGGSKPREASSIAGAIYFTVCLLQPFSSRGIAWDDGVLIVFCFSLGLILSYVAGVLVAGIFLLIDRLRVYVRFTKSSPEEPAEPFDNIL